VREKHTLFFFVFVHTTVIILNLFGLILRICLRNIF